jgi:hypothetical protein
MSRDDGSGADGGRTEPDRPLEVGDHVRVLGGLAFAMPGGGVVTALGADGTVMVTDWLVTIPFGREELERVEEEQG